MEVGNISDGNRVNVGNCGNDDNVNVNNWDDNGNNNIGLAASRNFFLCLTKTPSLLGAFGLWSFG